MTELEFLRKSIRERMNYYTDELASGSAKDFSDYRYFVGMIEGLAWAERDLLDIVEKLQSQD